MSTPSKSAIADLVANFGSSSATAWLEFDRYKLWFAPQAVPESSFTPVQGYMERDPYVFAWGNPLVSSPEALPAVARQFIDFVESQGKKLIWSCVDNDLEEVLGGEEFGWSTVSCIYEDVVDPAHVLQLTSPEAKGQEGQGVVKDLKKNLYRANKYEVHVAEVKGNQWTREEKAEVEEGIKEWKAHKKGLQIASTTLQPWLDQEHRRYWLAKKDNAVIGILILTPIQHSSWQIKNAISFPKAPKGTSEALIHTALRDLHSEEDSAATIPLPERRLGQLKASSETTSVSSDTDGTSLGMGTSRLSSPSDASLSSVSSASDAGSNGDVIVTKESTKAHRMQTATHHRDTNRVTVTFGISAAPELDPIHNLSGWKVNMLSKTYGKVAKAARLIQRGEFRSKFDSMHEPMYVCYPPDGFGLEGVNSLLKVLKK